MRLSLIKCHGSGNDFPLIDARTVHFDDEVWAAVAVALADRAGPVGGDGLLALTKGDGDHAFGMRMWNSDGSEAELCLNGLRCVARLGFERLEIDEAAIRCKASTVQAARAPDLAPGVYTVREVAGPAMLDVTAWPMNIGKVELVETPLSRLGSARAFTAVAMPNPHLITFVQAVDEAELVTVGGAAQKAAAWMPNRANVSFVELRANADADHKDLGLFVRTFERGVGLTDSCGSAMAASTYAACLTDRIAYDEEITVWNKGGMVRASAEIGGEVTLSGNATWEWTGSLDVDAATGAVTDVQIERRFDDEVAAYDELAAVAPGARLAVPMPRADPEPEAEAPPLPTDTAPHRDGGVTWDGFTISARSPPS